MDKIVFRKPHGKRALQRFRFKWNYDIKMDFEK